MRWVAERSGGVIRTHRAGLEFGVLLGAFACAVGGAWIGAARWAEPSAPTGPLPTPLPGAFRYFDPLPTPAPTRVGLDRRFTPDGLEGGLPHEVLSALPDPNTTDPRYTLQTLQSMTETVGGPRLVLASAAANSTLDLGEVTVDRPITVPLVLANAGDQPLRLARIYAPSNALSVEDGVARLGAGGWLSAPLVIPIGAQHPLLLRLDPAETRAPGESGPLDAGAQALYLQLFSNDRSAPRLDDGDPLSGEHRLRVVYAVRSPDAPGRPVGLAERPLDAAAPRLWVDEGERWGRGGRVIDIGPVDPSSPGTATATLRNLGTAPLNVKLTGQAIDGATLDDAVVPPLGATRLRIALPSAPPDDALRAHGAYWHRVRLQTNDPLLPTVDLAFLGTTARSVVPGGP